MKKLLCIILAMALCFTFTACSGEKGKDKSDKGSESAVTGRYDGRFAEMFGEVTPLEEIYEGESYIELKSDNKCTFTMDGDIVEGCTWKLDVDKLSISLEMEGETETLTGTLKDGVIVIDMMGIPMTFSKDGAKVEMPTGSGKGEPSDEEPTEDDTEDPSEDDRENNFPTEEQIARYKGDWNGAVGFRNCTGMYEYLNDTNTTAIARFLIDDLGFVTPFIGLNVQDTPIEDLSAYIDTERDALVISGTWIEQSFSDVPSIELSGTVSFTVPISNDYGSVEMHFNFRPLGDEGWTDEDPGLSEQSIEYCRGMTFDEVAALNGYSQGDYPAE